MTETRAAIASFWRLTRPLARRYDMQGRELPLLKRCDLDDLQKTAQFLEAL